MFVERDHVYLRRCIGVDVKKIIPLIALLTLLTALTMSAQNKSQEPLLAITHVSVIDATGSPVQPDMTVTLRGDRIIKIEKTGKSRLPKDAKIVDASGKFLIPGLWDMHVHTIFGEWIPGGREVSLPLFVASGVTGVRDMGGDLDTLLAWKREISAGTLLGPRMVIAGPMLDGPKSRFPSSLSIATPDEGRKAVDELKAKGVDFIKIQSFIPRDAYFAVVEESRKQGLIFAGHVPDALRAAEASDAGQKSIEHLTGVFEGCSTATAEDEFLKGKKSPKRFLESYDGARCAALIARLARNRTWQVPTLVWERGQWLVDDIDFSHDPLLKYAPASWQQKSWPNYFKGIHDDLVPDPVSLLRNFRHKDTQ